MFFFLKNEFLDHDDSFPNQEIPRLVGKMKIYYRLYESLSQIRVYLARHHFPQQRPILANVSEDGPLLLMFSNKFLLAYHRFVIWATVFNCFVVFLLQKCFAKDKKYEVQLYASRYRLLLFPCLRFSHCPKLNLRIYILPWVWETKFNALKNTNKITLFW